jgi:esterase
LIVLHGLFGSCDNWRVVAKLLDPSRQVICADLRNHGHSPHVNSMSFAEMAEDVAVLMDHAGLAAADVLGHSMGGKTAMEFALRYPSRVQRLIVVDIAARAYSPRHLDILAALSAIDPGSYKSRAEIEQALLPAIPEVDVLRFLLKNLQRDSDGALSWRFGLAEIFRNYSELNRCIAGARVFSGPALLLRGADSDYVTDSDFDSFCSLFPQAQLTMIEGAGHWPHADNPACFAESVTAFLRGERIPQKSLTSACGRHSTLLL